MREPLVVEKPIEHGRGFVIGSVNRNDTIYFYFQDDIGVGNYASGYFTNPSPELIAFIEKAKKHFQPLKKLDMTVDEFKYIAFGSRCFEGYYERAKERAAEHGFEFKEG